MDRKTRDIFSGKFAGHPIVVRSPGRINIIGEHTDYNHGFVLPAAIDKFIYVGAGKRDDDAIKLYADTFAQCHESTVTSAVPSDKGWPNYVLGVVDQLKKHGYKIGGFNLVITGDIPHGAGLSSSAALECASIFALNELFSLGLARLSMVKMSQLAEHEFAGVKCGIMDQFASMFGKKDHLLKLDCDTLEYEYIPVNLQGHKIMLLNSNVNHSLASTEYNVRRAQCEQAVKWVSEKSPQINSLRDITIAMLDQYVLNKSPEVYKRSRYIIEENRRLLHSCELLKAGNLKALGQEMLRTHKGLSEEYEVSCKEIDFLVDCVKQDPDVLGARLMGGGFGGCTINIVKEEAVERLIADISNKYKAAMNLDLTIYIAAIEQGTELITQKRHSII